MLLMISSTSSVLLQRANSSLWKALCCSHNEPSDYGMQDQLVSDSGGKKTQESLWLSGKTKEQDNEKCLCSKQTIVDEGRKVNLPS
jgi:hypothetical protein